MLLFFFTPGYRNGIRILLSCNIYGYGGLLSCFGKLNLLKIQDDMRIVVSLKHFAKVFIDRLSAAVKSVNIQFELSILEQDHLFFFIKLQRMFCLKIFRFVGTGKTGYIGFPGNLKAAVLHTTDLQAAVVRLPKYYRGIKY